jgi:hypothetical protein
MDVYGKHSQPKPKQIQRHGISACRLKDATMQLEYAKNPVWANAEHTMIDLEIKLKGGERSLPFTASPTDCEAHGREIFAAAVVGEYGEVAEFVPYVPTQEEKAEAIRSERDVLLAATDWTQLPDVPDTIREAYAVYRQALRDVTEQSGFPSDIQWPAKPE